MHAVSRSLGMLRVLCQCRVRIGNVIFRKVSTGVLQKANNAVTFTKSWLQSPGEYSRQHMIQHKITRELIPHHQLMVIN